ncbi:uncharacterized protein LOC143284796 [Babylonia areolata]|uniref:uncharacterized protein LOC143284796 n=1 Tax=Babylonia areolata TaxID=304850 RepID=UPI003FD5A40E
MDLDQLQLEVDGVTRSFAEWTSDFVDSHYPNVGHDCYRVPALHFNQQPLSHAAPAAGTEPQLLLDAQDKSIAVGDLAHTIVLERLEELSHHLRATGQGPLFIISAVNYDSYLAKLPASRPKTKRRRSSSKSEVKLSQLTNEPKQSHSKAEVPRSHPPAELQTIHQSFPAAERKHSNSFSETTGGKEARPACDGLKEDSKIKEDEGKQLLPPRPSDKGQRGEIDILLLHRNGGVVLIEVKATGHASSPGTSSEEDLQLALQRRVERAWKQLRNGRDILQYVMPDLCLPEVTLVVAFPYVTRETLTQAVSTLSLDPNLQFLCKDDLNPLIPGNPLSPSQAAESNAGCSPQDVDIPGLSWWQNTICYDVSKHLSVDSMKTIVGRICGLMSVVSVWTVNRPRLEVRTTAQAIMESGRRLADIVLLPCQTELLAQPSLHRLWLTGPMGSGKTLMLQLKGRHWLKEGRRVIVINVRIASRGRPQGHVLEESIRRGMDGHSGPGSVERHDVALDELQFESLQRKLAAGGPTENACFVVDELLTDMSVIIQTLAQHYPDCPIWCVAACVSPVPNTFLNFKLGSVLRSPPSVQLMLKELDLNSKHKFAYMTRSATGGLPCDGPPIIFIEHFKHNTQVRHLDCSQCANELADILENKVGLKLHPSSPEADNSTTRSADTLSKSLSLQPNAKEVFDTVEASSPSFRDVLILIVLPSSAFKYKGGYHWEASMPEVLRFGLYMGTSHFVSTLRQRGVPLKYAVDNTLKEIAFPTKDEVVISDILGAHGLERKVVVLMRSGPPLTEEEVTEHFSRYQTIQAASNTGGQSEMSCIQEFFTNPMDSGSSSKQQHIFISLMHEVSKYIYPELTIPLSPSPEEAKYIFRRLFGDMLVKETQSFTAEKIGQEGLHSQQTQMTPQTLSSLTKPRCGMEYRCDPLLLPSISHNQSKDTEASPAAQPEARCGEGAEERNFVFSTPGMQEHLEQRQREVRRIQQAMESLSEDDKGLGVFCCLTLPFSVYLHPLLMPCCVSTRRYIELFTAMSQHADDTVCSHFGVVYRTC